ncbi:MAG: hypothetical protein QOG58_977 [Caballeronia sp.]|jgi:hypothetical protein|nr:hypothetical protein [Caballeronia sp.]
MSFESVKALIGSSRYADAVNDDSWTGALTLYTNELTRNYQSSLVQRIWKGVKRWKGARFLTGRRMEAILLVTASGGSEFSAGQQTAQWFG